MCCAVVCHACSSAWWNGPLSGDAPLRNSVAPTLLSLSLLVSAGLPDWGGGFEALLAAALSECVGGVGAASGTRGGGREGVAGACAGEACAWLSSGAAFVLAAAGVSVGAGAVGAAAAALREDLFLRVIPAGGQRRGTPGRCADSQVPPDAGLGPRSNTAC